MVIGITPTLIVLRLNIGVPGSRYGTNPTVRSTNVAPSNLTFARAPTTQLESQYPPGRLNSTTLTTFGEEEDKYSVKDQGASSSTVQIELRKVTKVEVKNSEDKTVPVIPHQPSTSHG
ncbi:hypothetical protein FRC03_007156 [Tulasnella sp. 419]|nr:hypothetical protein FRC03_007156 [Tulasnella sp. 419]